MLTAAQLQAATGCTAANAATFAPLLGQACSHYSINTPQRLAAFLAQIGHESGSFRWLREIWGPTPTQSRYEGRKDLGNTQPGDGSRYRGRGLIQTTGRANYRALTRRLVGWLPERPDFEANPEALEQPKWAAISAADYWDMRGLNALADAGKFVPIGRAINRGNPNSQLRANGEDDRLARWKRAKAALAQIATEVLRPPLEHTKEKPMAPLIAMLGKVLIGGFAPLAAEKITKEIARHTDRPEVAEQVSVALIDAAKAATGIEDPMEAVVQARKDPEVMAKVEQSATATLATMAPLLERLDAMDRQQFADEEASRAAAAARSPSDWDMTPTLVYGALALVGALVLLVGGIAVYQTTQGQIAPEVWAQVAGLIGFGAGVCTTVYAFRFGTTRNSTAKDGVIRDLSGGRQ